MRFESRFVLVLFCVFFCFLCKCFYNSSLGYGFWIWIMRQDGVGRAATSAAASGAVPVQSELSEAYVKVVPSATLQSASRKKCHVNLAAFVATSTRRIFTASHLFFASSHLLISQPSHAGALSWHLMSFHLLDSMLTSSYTSREFETWLLKILPLHIFFCSYELYMFPFALGPSVV